MWDRACEPCMAVISWGKIDASHRGEVNNKGKKMAEWYLKNNPESWTESLADKKSSILEQYAHIQKATNNNTQKPSSLSKNLRAKFPRA